MKAKITNSGEIKIGEKGNDVIIKEDELKVKSEARVKSRTWEEQLERVRRSLKLAKNLCSGTVQITGEGTLPSSDICLDQIYNFFMNCYHLKDWLKNDAKFPADKKKEVEDFINKNQDLTLCANICNGHKHFTLDRRRIKKKRIKKNLRVTKQQAETHIKGDSIESKIQYKITTDSGERDALELAQSCLNLWEKFIQANP